MAVVVMNSGLSPAGCPRNDDGGGCPVGQNALISENQSSPLAKNISLYQKRKSPLCSTRPAPVGGAYRDRHGRGVAGCDGRIGATDERAGLGRRRRVVLVPRCWHQVRG